MICFVCQKAIEKNVQEEHNLVISINITTIEYVKGGGYPIIFCHGECFKNSAGELWQDEMYKRAVDIGNGKNIDDYITEV